MTSISTLFRSLPTRRRGLAIAAIVAVGLVLIPDVASAAQMQAGELGQQRLGRAYWHVFASYAVAWVLLFGWIIAMFRRLRRVEERLSDAE